MSSPLDKVLAASSWQRIPGASADAPASVPEDYRALVKALGPGEGFIGKDFLRLYPPQELRAIAESYGFPEYLPGLLPFGSNGMGSSYAFVENEQWAVVCTPFVPMDRQYSEPVTSGALALAELFAKEPAPRYAPNPKTWQMEMEARHPLALGGSPGPANTIFVPPAKHVELVRFWNKVIRQKRAEKSR